MPGFNFGAPAGGTTTAASTGFNFGMNKPATSTPSLLGNPTTAASGAGGFSFGLAKTTAPAIGGFGASTTSTPGFSLGGTAATSTATGFSLGGTPATTSTTGFSLGTPATSSTGFSLGGAPGSLSLSTPASTAAGGFSLGAPAATSSAASGFSFNKTTAAATPGFGGTGLLGSAPATTSSTTGLGGGLFGSSTATTSAGSIFSSLPTSTTAKGLGGVDPNTSLKQGSGDGPGAASDGKTLKESLLVPQLVATVDNLQKFVKDEKCVREDIARMSSKPMARVQEEVTALRQLLAVVSTGLQRNACSVDTLKKEMTQKLKNAEMAQRTRDVPPGLQYENTAPTGFFHQLVEEFEDRMVSYRQQIETLDSHLAALHNSGTHTPSEFLALLKKQHETFISLAAQLQTVHEAVKSQKDQYLVYRRVFHSDTKNVFHKPATPAKVPRKIEVNNSLAGPNPFPGTTNAAARAMALVQNLAAQPQGPPVTGLVQNNISGFGSGTFGSGGLLNTSKPNTGFTGFGSSSLSTGGPSIGGVGNLFSSTGFGSSVAPPTLGTSTTAALNLAGTNANNLAAGMRQPQPQPFTLQKPPAPGGNKRGKR